MTRPLSEGIASNRSLEDLRLAAKGCPVLVVPEYLTHGIGSGVVDLEKLAREIQARQPNYVI